MNIFKLWSTERVCRTRIISPDFIECMVKRPNPGFCEFSISMGNSYICKHPDRVDYSSRE